LGGDHPVRNDPEFIDECIHKDGDNIDDEFENFGRSKVLALGKL
jgi:hypothetical protein